MDHRGSIPDRYFSFLRHHRLWNLITHFMERQGAWSAHHLLYCVAVLHHILSFFTYTNKQHRQCRYNVTTRRVHETIVAVEKHQVQYYILACVCVHRCSLTYPARKAPPYCHLRPLWLHHIFRHYLINGTIFGKRLLNTKCVLIVTRTFIWTFLILRRIQHVSCENTSCKVPRYSRRILMKFEFSRHIIEKNSNIKFHQNLLDGSRDVPCGRTDGNETNSRFSQFCERA